MGRESFWSGTILAGISAVLLFYVVPNHAGRGMPGLIPPQTLPGIGATVMLVCALAVALRGAVTARRAGVSLLPAGIPWQAIWMGLWPFLYVAASIYAIQFVPLTYAGPFIIAGLMLLLGVRKPLPILICALAPAVLLYVLSVYLMRVGIV